jgi:hypothetical protein
MDPNKEIDMNGIQGVGGISSMAQLLMKAGPSATGGPPQGMLTGELPAGASTITGSDGQSLLDIREEMKAAVSDALQNYDGEGDLRATIQDTIHATLEENGFDPAEVKSAMTGEGGFPPIGGMQGGAPLSFLQALESGSPSSSTDLASMLQSGGAEDDMIQNFLAQFRAGLSLDLTA